MSFLDDSEFFANPATKYASFSATRVAEDAKSSDFPLPAHYLFRQHQAAFKPLQKSAPHSQIQTTVKDGNAGSSGNHCDPFHLGGFANPHHNRHHRFGGLPETQKSTTASSSSS